MSDLQLYITIKSLPENIKKEVFDFIDFLKYKNHIGQPKKKERKFGYAKGMIKMHPDFDDPLDDFKEYMK